MTAKRKLSEFDFSKQGCHISLVNKEVGYAANGKPCLVLKALSSAEGVTSKEISVEMIEKSAVEAMVVKAVEEATATLKAELVEKQKQIDAIETEKKEAILKSRKEKLEAAVGDIEAAALIEVVKGMEEAAFEVVLKSVSAAVDKQADGVMFKEMGVSGKAEPAVKHFADFLPKKSK